MVTTVGEHTIRDKPRDGPDETPYFAYALSAVCALGVVLRAVHLDIPMRYDEAVTYMSYASHGWEYVTTHYENPNNHVFHSLLVSWLTAWLGGDPLVIRLPAFVAGCALAPAAAWVAYRAFGRGPALIAASVVATAPTLIEFSTNARGYSLVSLCVVIGIGTGLRILNGGGLVAWMAWIEVGVIGLYSIPTMAVPWLGLTGWLAWGLARRSKRRATVRALAPLAGATLLVGAVTIALYWGIIATEGIGALMGNRFVAPEPMRTFLADTPEEFFAIVRYWSRGVPLPLVALALSCAVPGIRSGGGEGEWRRCVGSLGAGVLVAILVVRNWGEPRIWQWAVPVLAITAAAGAMSIGRRIAWRVRVPWAATVASAWAGLMVAQIFFADPVRSSLDTGGFPEATDVFEGIVDSYRQGDAIVGDFVSSEPLRFYFERWLVDNEAPPRGDMERVWVVVNGRDSTRAQGVHGLLERMGAPPLEEIRPVLTRGEVAVYLLGRPAGAPDPRLLEAIDWHTGVAGYVDEVRARALISEVAEETGSSLALAWMIRCSALGCMDLAGGDVPAGSLRDGRQGSEAPEGVLAELRELAGSGEVEAAFLVASALDEGWAGPVDMAESALWYQRAAEAGHLLAARRLAAALEAGRGVERNDSAAVAWWRRAAEAGDAEAQLRLGASYEAGRGVARDLAAARLWYGRALERRHPDARAALARLPAR